jgi:hypothetical protein
MNRVARARWALSLAVALGAVAPLSLALADDGGATSDALRASLTCEPLAAPGRLRCDVEARARDATLRWADVQVVRVPEFIAPLRGRSGPDEAAAREEDRWRWSLGLIARTREAGDVSVRVRAVVCVRDVCTPEVAVAVAHVTVGP